MSTETVNNPLVTRDGALDADAAEVVTIDTARRACANSPTRTPSPSGRLPHAARFE